MGAMNIWQWVLILVIVALIFGTKKLRGVGEDLGAAVKGFKEGMKSDEEKELERRSKQIAEKEEAIEGEVKEKNISK